MHLAFLTLLLTHQAQSIRVPSNYLRGFLSFVGLVRHLKLSHTSKFDGSTSLLGKNFLARSKHFLSTFQSHERESQGQVNLSKCLIITQHFDWMRENVIGLPGTKRSSLFRLRPFFTSCFSQPDALVNSASADGIRARDLLVMPFDREGASKTTFHALRNVQG